ncbi:YjgN family protein [Neisseria iguanae]|uniref:DUF898 domain-containing protein n=1 Tax=Neisseria iguanae TaxID=90242 RepID=A0A2P7TZX7_9NEIS|nr:YjgN family protein [Neisseria iguanae]PSJ80290.1 DUF898 domain-containing protein [Neisseria iguanae]
MNTDWQPHSGSVVGQAGLPAQPQPLGLEPQEWRFQFFGNAGEYFKIWIVNLFLTIITLSFYSPWAKVRRMRYFYGNTELGGYRFDFTALPTRILMGRIIALMLFAGFSIASEIDPVIALGGWLMMMTVFPWLVRSTMRFRARNTKFGNSRFYFSASMGQTYWLFIKCALAVLLSFGLLYPLALYWFKSYQTNHLQVGHVKLKLKADVGNFYAAVLVPYLIMLAVLIAMAVVVGMFAGGPDMATVSENVTSDWLVSVIGLMYVAVLGYFVPLTQGYLFQAVWQNVSLGSGRVSTELSPFKFAWIKFTNYLATVFTLGMLYPWGVVRLYRYQADTLKVYTADNPENLMNAAQQDYHATGEEIADVFDIDLSL